MPYFSNAEPTRVGDTPPPGKPLRSLEEDALNDAAREALTGDPFALRKFLHAISPLVRKVCRGVMGRDSQDLEDAIQDCLIDVVRALPQFRFEADVSHYITKIAMRRAITSRQRSRARLQQFAPMDLQNLSVEQEATPLDTRVALLRNLLDQLSEAQATVLRLRLMLGHSIEEIAGITGVSVNTVKTRLRLGKIQLRRRLVRSGEKPSERRR